MSSPDGTAAAFRESPDEALVFWKISVRLLPFLFLLYVINLIDRTNVAIARLQMVQELKILDEKAYSLGFGIFYVGYLLFEVPSNLILARMGARAWMARILLTWGIISSAMMFVTGPESFIALRVLLGVAEAGFFPGVIYYLNNWFPGRVRAQALAKFMMGGVIASLAGNSLSGVILEYMDQVGGLWGWQWVFLLEGLPAVILGFVTLWYLTDRPQDARWLNPEERAWLMEQIAADRRQQGRAQHYSWLTAAIDPRVWLFIAIYFTAAVGENSYSSHVPTFLSTQFPGYSKLEIALLTAAPSVLALTAMILVCRHSDKSGERPRHVAAAAFAAALGWLTIAAVAQGLFALPSEYSRWIFVAGVAITHMAMKSMLPLFWTLPPLFFSGPAAAGAIALINSVANLGGFVGPIIFGEVKTQTGSYTDGYFIMSAVLCAGGLLAMTVRVRNVGGQKSEVGDENSVVQEVQD